MRLVLFQAKGADAVLPGLLTDRGVVDVSAITGVGYAPQLTMTGIIDRFETLRPVLEKAQAGGDATPLEAVKLHAPLPRPGKILG